MKANQKNNNRDKFNNLYILIALIIVFWLGSFFLIKHYLFDLNDRALLGDSFGVVNSLFSGLAFAGIIYTIVLQRKELSLQRQELKETRKELQRSATAQENSEKQQKRQSENLKITAKLNALSTLVSYYSDLETKTGKTNVKLSKDAKMQQEIFIDKIKTILSNKEMNDGIIW